ncbi:MAG: GNAT family N-acetyltransferase [Bacteroidales bacterium]|jgi:diamine N-acetyltransferase|nr:GNAT family N-acetyltransferase [Bacteroidales bacterium]
MLYRDIKLRALEPEDLELRYRWENDPSYWKGNDTIMPVSRYTLKRYIEESHNKSIYETKQVRLMIDYTPDNVSVGALDIFDFDPYHLRAEIGILIADKKYRRRGIASMSLECIINYCFKTLHLHQLYCNIRSDNSRSINLFCKLGFVHTGVKKEWAKTPSGYTDEYTFQLINRD